MAGNYWSALDSTRLSRRRALVARHLVAVTRGPHNVRIAGQGEREARLATTQALRPRCAQRRLRRATCTAATTAASAAAAATLYTTPNTNGGAAVVV